MSSRYSPVRRTSSTLIQRPSGHGCLRRRPRSRCPSSTTRRGVCTGLFPSREQRWNERLINQWKRKNDITITLFQSPGRHQQHNNTKHDVHKDVAEVWTVVRRQSQHRLRAWILIRGRARKGIFKISKFRTTESWELPALIDNVAWNHRND